MNTSELALFDILQRYLFTCFSHNTNNIEYRYNNADFRQISSWFSTIPFWKGSYRIVRLSLWGINLALNSNFPWLCSPNQGPTPHGPASFERHGREGHWCEAQTDLDDPTTNRLFGGQVEEPNRMSHQWLLTTFDDSPQQTEPWRHNTEHDKSWTQLNAKWKDKSYASTCCSSGSGAYTENESKEKQRLSRTISPISHPSTHWKPFKEVLEVWVRFDPSILGAAKWQSTSAVRKTVAWKWKVF